MDNDSNAVPVVDELNEEEKDIVERVLKPHLPEELKNAPADAQAQWFMKTIRARRRHKEEQKLFDAYLSVIEAQYKHLHPHLFKLEGWALSPGFSEAIETQNKELILKLVKYVSSTSSYDVFVQKRSKRNLFISNVAKENMR